jgi:hypothetical protein
MFQPYATYHLLFLGTFKHFMTWLLGKLGVKSSSQKDVDEALPDPIQHPKLVRDLIACRLKHFVLRSVSKCGVCNFLEHLSAMTIAEMQLLLEVVLPYLVHDWVHLGVPERLVLMWYALMPPAVVPWSFCSPAASAGDVACNAVYCSGTAALSSHARPPMEHRAPLSSLWMTREQHSLRVCRSPKACAAASTRGTP